MLCCSHCSFCGTFADAGQTEEEVAEFADSLTLTVPNLQAGHDMRTHSKQAGKWNGTVARCLAGGLVT